MSSAELREKFLDFFKERGHKIVLSSSLIPDDPSVLLTTAGMQQFKKYYTDPALAPAPNIASIQKCFRTSDIDEVGDESHLTFFEMLGNFSFGGYFKEDAIKYAKEFLESIGLKIEYVSVFEGETESEKIWRDLGISRIEKRGKEDNFWGPTGKEGPCGPTTEIYIDGVEIWNIVFNEFYQKPDGSLEKLKTPGVDTGMGLERLAMASQGKKNIFETDLFASYFELLPKELDLKTKRIIIDHLRGGAFLLADGVRPSNKEVGYILRRLMRRVLVYENLYKIPAHVFDAILHDVAHGYGEFYPELLKASEAIRGEFKEEREKFLKTLPRGLKEVNKIIKMSGAIAFDIYQSFGIAPEIIYELKKFDWKEFEEAKNKHKSLSSDGQEKKFGGHGLLLDTGELKAVNEEELKKVTRLHTATHLLQAALRKVLGDAVEQRGSDITSERTRFDFTFGRKLAPEEIKKTEDLVNKTVSEGLEVRMEEMDIEAAKKSGALYFFKEKYPERVKVYSVGGSSASSEPPFSRELCGGPHVENTREVGKFVILKEEAVAAGVRRIRATVG
ncbi:MAG: alanine--tRNA ligase-related protein [bacterium]|nr:alanine--tRNA ligase-related protein [bacterium]